jgi:hypothetical protein
MHQFSDEVVRKEKQWLMLLDDYFLACISIVVVQQNS